MSLATLLTDAVSIWRHRAPSDVDHRFPDVTDAPPDTRRMIRNRQYCRVLSNQHEIPFDDVSIACGWKALEHDMALVPGGEIRRVCDVINTTRVGFELTSNADQVIEVESLYIDRDCVTNADFFKFVSDNGYGNSDYWPDAVLPNVLQFTNGTGHPGPRFWPNGNPPPDRLLHPVVGVCWYEANAYATWACKRLPSSDEWQRAGTWPKGHSGDGTEVRYPWGNGFDPAKANVWASGINDTVSVQSFNAGSTPNGVRQLIGNVWEWVDTQFYPTAGDGVSILLDQSMAEIRGGAFDTYFQTQASCQFYTGQPLLFRGPNVGFRCCMSASDLRDSSNAPTLDSDAEQ